MPTFLLTNKQITQGWILSAFTALLLLIPATTSAKQTLEWSFTDIEQVQGWTTNNLTNLELFSDGLVIETETEGFMSRLTDDINAIDTVIITYFAQEPGEMLFIWQPRSSQGNEIYHIPIELKPSPGLQVVGLNMSNIDNWDRKSTRIGFILPAGTSVLLRKMELESYTLWDSMAIAAKTFWKFDSLRAYSINFLWGPLLTFNEVQYNELFLNTPPIGTSANIIFYIIMAMGLLYLFVQFPKLRGDHECRRVVVTHFFILFAALWFLYDVRMGSEAINYFIYDYKTYHSVPPERAQYRDRGVLPQFSSTVNTIIKGQKNYIFLANFDWPYLGKMRYETYPALPVKPEHAKERINTWVVYKKPDVSLNKDFQLVLGDEILSASGTMVHTFSTGSFVFHVGS